MKQPRALSPAAGKAPARTKRPTTSGKTTSGRCLLSDLAEREVRNAARGERAEFMILDDLLAHGFSREELYSLVLPRRTFARRKQVNARLSAEETDRAVRIARLTAMAERVFGEQEKAHRWLRKPSRTLDGAVPLNLMKSESGAHLVEQTLHRIDYGILA